MTQETILGTIEFACIAAIMLTMCIFLIIYTIKKSKLQQEYIKTLNDHDKAIITTYQHIEPFNRKKKEK